MKTVKGRGAQFDPPNPFLKREIVSEHPEGIDEELMMERPPQEIFYENPRKVINKVDSPDLRLGFSINPYQGCEHGCVYCYARNAHTYWGFSAGLDFERKIIVKKNAPQILSTEFQKRTWKPAPVMLSGNTDCYQPLERKFRITRGLMETFLRYRNPVGMITKNQLILRDLDILKELAALNLVHVFISITTLQEDLKRILEPRTSSIKRRFETVLQLSEAGIPVGIMMAPIIPSLNDHEIPDILRKAAEYKAYTASYTVVRLNGQVGEIFRNWIFTTLPDRADKVWKQIESLHGGRVNDSKFGRRMKGEGNYSKHINLLFHTSKRKYLKEVKMPELNCSSFIRPGETLGLFN